MSSLTLALQPGFTDVDPAHFDAGNPASDVDLKAVNDNAKFAAVRTETFWGFYKHGETVALPESGADGYTYVRSELVYVWSIFWTGAPPSSALNGTQATPARLATSGQGTLLQMGALVDPATGVVSCDASYFKTGQTDTHDGILLVTTIATRLR